MKGKLILKQNLDSQQINPYSQGSKLLGASLIPIYESENNLTAQEINKQIVDEILLKKEQEKKSTQQSEFNTDDVIKLQKLIPGLKKCKFHTKKLSSKCKECQIITITVQKHELELRNKIKKELDQKMFEKQENTIEATEEISNENINDNNKEDNIVINDSPQSNSGFNSNINANQCIIPSNSNIPYNMMAYQIPIPNMQIPIPMNLPNMPHINAMMLQKMPYMNFPMNSQMNQFNQVSQFNQFQLINQQIPIIPKFKPLELSQYEFIPVTDQSSCNLNPLLHNNILSCHYFKELYNTKHSFGEMCLEITEKVTSVEPWALGQIGIPSTIFCCLYRLMLMKLNIYQLKLLINNGELTSEMQNPAVYAVLDININTKLKPSIFLKTVGYLYLRFLANPIELLTWFEPDLGNVNQYPLLLKANKDLEHGITSSTSIDIEFGEFLDKVLRNTDYYNTRFPKIPVLIEKEIINKLDEYKEFRKRKNANIEEFDSLRVGSRIIVKISATGESVIKHKWVSAVVVGFNEDSVDDFISVRLDNDEEILVELGNLIIKKYNKKNEFEEGELKDEIIYNYNEKQDKQVNNYETSIYKNPHHKKRYDSRSNSERRYKKTYDQKEEDNNDKNKYRKSRYSRSRSRSYSRDRNRKRRHDSREKEWDSKNKDKKDRNNNYSKYEKYDKRH